MKRSTYFSTLALATLAAVAVPVLAAPGDGQPRDPNRTTTRADVATRAAEHFAKMDANKDGKIDASDRAAHQAERRGEMFAKLDTDGNGSINRVEWDAHAADRMAKHGDRRAAMAKRGPHRMDEGEPGMGRHGRRGEHGRGGVMAMLAQADANGDKAISADEMRTAMLARFDRMDSNKDGTVTGDERRAARPAGRGPKPAMGESE